MLPTNTTLNSNLIPNTYISTIGVNPSYTLPKNCTTVYCVIGVHKDDLTVNISRTYDTYSINSYGGRSDDSQQRSLTVVIFTGHFKVGDTITIKKTASQDKGYTVITW